MRSLTQKPENICTGSDPRLLNQGQSSQSELHQEVGDLYRQSRLAIPKSSMALSLSQEVKDRLDLGAPAIVFFALPVRQQIDVLPTLDKEQKYDFSQGDLCTSNALEVLLTAYANCLNNLLNWLVVMADESRSQEVEILNSLIEDLLNTAHTIVDDCFEEIGSVDSLESPEWSKLRRLSQRIQQQLQIELEANTTAMSNFIDYWLHA